jgi:hypothetical protein
LDSKEVASDETLDTILDDKFKIKSHLMQLWRARNEDKNFMEESHERVL